MKTYRHLIYPERKLIEYLLQQEYSQAAIARQLNVHRSTVKKEIDRNSIEGIYTAKDAQGLSLKRKERNTTYCSLRKRSKIKSPKYPTYNSLFFYGKSSVLLGISPYSKDQRQRFQRKLKDLRKKRRYFYRKLNEKQTAAKVWWNRRKERNHLLEGYKRRRRTLQDFLGYHRVPWRDMKFYKGYFFIGKYYRRGRASVLHLSPKVENRLAEIGTHSRGDKYNADTKSGKAVGEKNNKSANRNSTRYRSLIKAGDDKFRSLRPQEVFSVLRDFIENRQAAARSRKNSWQSLRPSECGGRMGRSARGRKVFRLTPVATRLEPSDCVAGLEPCKKHLAASAGPDRVFCLNLLSPTHSQVFQTLSAVRTINT